MSTPSKATANQKIESTHESDDQLEILGDIDQDSIVLNLGERMGIELISVVNDIVVERTIEGASTITVSVIDYERELLRKGNLKKEQDIKIDKLWFRLSGINKMDDRLDLIFEEKEIAILRTYNKKLGPVERSEQTRAEFILRMIKEPKEMKMKYVIPELHKIQPLEKDEDVQPASTQKTQKTSGIPDDAGVDPGDAHHHPDVVTTDPTQAKGLTVKGAAATPEQVRNANVILQVGQSMGARRKVLVSAIMTATQESSIRNLDEAHSDGASAGIFQQTPGHYGGMTLSERMTPATAARVYFLQAIKIDKEEPGLAYYDLCQRVQRSAYPKAYSQWRTEGERWVTAYGVTGGDNMGPTSLADQFAAFQQSSDGAYYFYRGIPPTTGHGQWKKEDSWTCIQRLADEVDWRAFFVSGTFYYMDEFTLFRSKPRMRLSEDMEGVGYINFNFNTNKKAATITIRVNLGRWGAPPGSVVLLEDMGPVNGRWIVENIRRSIYSEYADITISKPRPELPEPLGPNMPGQQTTITLVPQDGKKPGQYQVGTATVQPIPGHPSKDTATHNTLGGRDPKTGVAKNFPAIDFFAPPGSDVVAPAGGKIYAITGKPTSMGAWAGAGGPFGRSVYIQTPGGTLIYITHLDDNIQVHEGQTVSAGQVIGQVGDYPGTTADHAHVGVETGSDGITVHTIANSPGATKKK